MVFIPHFILKNLAKTKIKFQKLFNSKLKKALIKSDFVIYQSKFSKAILDQELHSRKKFFYNT